MCSRSVLQKPSQATASEVSLEPSPPCPFRAYEGKRAQKHPNGEGNFQKNSVQGGLKALKNQGTCLRTPQTKKLMLGAQQWLCLGALCSESSLSLLPNLPHPRNLKAAKVLLLLQAEDERWFLLVCLVMRPTAEVPFGTSCLIACRDVEMSA